jgi:hypothetical protein
MVAELRIEPGAPGLPNRQQASAQPTELRCTLHPCSCVIVYSTYIHEVVSTQETKRMFVCNGINMVATAEYLRSYILLVEKNCLGSRNVYCIESTDCICYQNVLRKLVKCDRLPKVDDLCNQKIKD